MTKLIWDRVNEHHPIWGRDYRKKEKKPRPKKNPEIIVPVKYKARPVRSGGQRGLVPCRFPGCNNRLNPKNVNRHMSGFHQVGAPSSFERSAVPPNLVVSPRLDEKMNSSDPAGNKAIEAKGIIGLALVKQLESYLPRIVLKLVQDAGGNVGDLSEEVPSEMAATIRSFFKRLAQ
jgi:hypothetical protein